MTPLNFQLNEEDTKRHYWELKKGVFTWCIWDLMAGGISPVSPDSLYFYILSLYWSLGVQIFPVCVCFCRGVLHWRSRLPEVVLSSNNQEGAAPNTLPCELNEENTKKRNWSSKKGVFPWCIWHLMAGGISPCSPDCFYFYILSL